LTGFLPFFSFFAALPLRKGPIRESKRAEGVEKKEGEGPRFFPAGRKAGIFFRSLFGFGTVEFGIADNSLIML
jgi:hypothetical protein